VSVIGRVARALLPGVRQVHAQVARYAAAWEQANGRTMVGAGPLWVVLGDSTAQGIGAPAWDEGYVGQLLAALDAGTAPGDGPRWRVLNLSRSGARTTDVLDRQLPATEALAAPAELVTCAIGANDIVGRVPPSTLEDRLRRIVARLPAGAVVATLPQGLSAERTAAANRAIREAAAAAGVAVADVWARTGPPWHGKFAADRFHPGALGYADWAAAFADALPAALRLQPPDPRQPPHRLGSGDPQ
jgi:lysophospholipase L1-like esterase